MNLIHQNPFRILGLPINASEKDIARRISELDAYTSVGKVISYDTDFPCLSAFERTTETVREAANRIETADGRLFYTFFWFWKYNSVDELALDVLKDGNIDKAINLLENQLKDEKLSSHTYSTAKNLICLYMASSRNGIFDPAHLSKCLLWTGRFFEDDMLHGYVTWISGKHFSFDRRKTISSFVDEFLNYSKPLLSNSDVITKQQFVSMFSSFSSDIQRSIANRFASEHILKIENAIKISEKKRKSAPENAYSIGRRLFANTFYEIEGLIQILSDKDVKYQSAADKVAEELLSCSIDYFNFHLDLNQGEAFGEKALKLVEHAKTLAFGKKIHLRIHTNRSIMEEHVNDWRESKKQLTIRTDYDSIKKRINALPDVDTLNASAIKDIKNELVRFLTGSIENLFNIQKVSGSDNEDYLDASSSVVKKALEMCIEYTKRVRNPEDMLSVMLMLADFDMNSETSERYQENRAAILRKLTVTIGCPYPRYK